MDPAALAAIFISAQFGQIQADAATKILKMKASGDVSLAKALVGLAENANRPATVVAGVGQNLDVTA
jgi:hypothetical protein